MRKALTSWQHPEPGSWTLRGFQSTGPRNWLVIRITTLAFAHFQAVRRAEAKDATTRTAHGLDEAFLTNKTNHFEFAIFIEFFDLLKLTGRHVNGIVGFFDTGWKKLLLEYRQGIGFQAAKLHLI